MASSRGGDRAGRGGGRNAGRGRHEGSRARRLRVRGRRARARRPPGRLWPAGEEAGTCGGCVLARRCPGGCSRSRERRASGRAEARASRGSACSPGAHRASLRKPAACPSVVRRGGRPRGGNESRQGRGHARGGDRRRDPVGRAGVAGGSRASRTAPALRRSVPPAGPRASHSTRRRPSADPAIRRPGFARPSTTWTRSRRRSTRRWSSSGSAAPTSCSGATQTLRWSRRGLCAGLARVRRRDCCHSCSGSSGRRISTAANG